MNRLRQLTFVTNIWYNFQLLLFELYTWLVQPYLGKLWPFTEFILFIMAYFQNQFTHINGRENGNDGERLRFISSRKE